MHRLLDARTHTHTCKMNNAILSWIRVDAESIVQNRKPFNNNNKNNSDKEIFLVVGQCIVIHSESSFIRHCD